MSNIREVLEEIVAPEHPWFDPKKAVDEAELAINKIIEAEFKENYKRLADELIGEDAKEDYPGGVISIEMNTQNELRQRQRSTLSNQLTNMKGE